MIRALIVPVLLFLVSCQNSASIQGVRAIDPYNCVRFAEVANYYIAIGEAQTVSEITDYWNESKSLGVEKETIREQIGIICRLVYQSNDNEVLRGPQYGGYCIPLTYYDEIDWPFFPLAESNGIFFRLAGVCFLAGVAEDPIDYLDYCRHTGIFRKEPLFVPSYTDAEKALESLFDSEQWKKTKWGEDFESEVFDMLAGQKLISNLKAQL